MEHNFDETLAYADLFLAEEALHSTPTALELSNFACGFGSPLDEEKVLNAMIASDEVRGKVFDFRRIVEQLTEVPLTKISPKSEDEALVARSLRERAEAILGFCVEPTSRDNSSSWRAAVEAFADAAKGLLGLPRYAATRSARLSSLIAIIPGVTAKLSVERNGETVNAAATLDGEVSLAKGRTLFLTLEDPVSGSLPLAGSVIEGPTVEISLQNFPSGIPADFGLSLGDSTSWPDKCTTIATVQDSGRIVPINLCGTPTIDDGHLNLEIELTAPVRAEFSQADLSLALRLGGISQQLGIWPINEWGSEPRKLSIQVPSSSNGAFHCSSLLSAQIV